MSVSPQLVDRVLIGLTRMIVVLVGTLVASSLLGWVLDLGSFPVAKVQRLVAIVSIVLSAVLIGVHARYAKHPLAEYWVVALLGGLAGALYLT